jgi:hypothetical protein
MHTATVLAVFVHCVYLANRETYGKGALVRTRVFHLFLQLVFEIFFVPISDLRKQKCV